MCAHYEEFRFSSKLFFYTYFQGKDGGCLMKQTLRVGLVGFGMIGKAHAYCYATLPYYAPNLEVTGKVVGVAASTPETSRRAQETIGCDWSTDNYLELINSPEIDVVHICTPNALHLDALLAAIDANKHVYCEKPIVADAREAAVLRGACKMRSRRRPTL